MYVFWNISVELTGLEVCGGSCICRHPALYLYFSSFCWAQDTSQRQNISMWCRGTQQLTISGVFTNSSNPTDSYPLTANATVKSKEQVVVVNLLQARK